MKYFDKYADIQSTIEISMHQYTNDVDVYVMLVELSSAVSRLYYEMDMHYYDDAVFLLIQLKNMRSHKSDGYKLNSLMLVVQINLHDLLLSLFAGE